MRHAAGSLGIAQNESRIHHLTNETMQTEITRERIALDAIRADESLQSRASLNIDAIVEYASAPDSELPPIVVFRDAKARYWLADGWHRYRAAFKRRQNDIACEVHSGSRRDALYYSLTANSKHGLRRTTEDKRKVVRALLDDKEWGKKSVRQIAAMANVSRPMVQSMVDERKPAPARTTVTQGNNKGKSAQPSEATKTEAGGSSATPSEAAKPKDTVVRADAEMPESYVDEEGNEVPESLFPVWRKIRRFAQISQSIRECGVIERLHELVELGEETGCPDTVQFALDAIERVKRIANDVYDRQPAFVRGEGWSSKITDDNF